MVTCNDYLIMQKKNAILITLPQTWKTLASTAPVRDRKECLTTEQEAILLNMVIQMLEGEEYG